MATNNSTSVEFIVEDDFHAETMGRYRTRAGAINKLVQLSETPFSEPPNLPPCTSGDRCRRIYWIIEYNTATSPWTKQSAEKVLTVTADGVVWDFQP